jgi:hypothetical protein
MRTAITLVLLLSLIAGRLSAQELTVNCKIDDLNGKIPLCLAHLWGQTLTIGGKATPIELVEFQFNNEADRPRTLQVSLQLMGLGESTTRTVNLAAKEKKIFAVSPVVDPKLANAVEDERVGKLQLEVKEGANVVHADLKNIALTGKDDIPTVVSNKPLFFFLVTRVQPKSRLVDQVLAASSERLGFRMQKGIAGYQGKANANQMHEDVRKIYKTIQAMGFKYVNTPISFTDGFQRIKSPTEALRTKTGNCIDGALVFASCLSAIGYNPLIAIVPGHAFVVATIPPEDMNKTRNDRLGLYGLARKKDSPSLDASRLYPSMLPIETTVLQNPSDENIGFTRTTFEEALRIGEAQFQKNQAEGKLILIDVEAWRKAGLIPISDSQ